MVAELQETTKRAQEAYRDNQATFTATLLRDTRSFKTEMGEEAKALEEWAHQQIKDIGKKASFAEQQAVDGKKRFEMHAASLAKLRSELDACRDAKERDLQAVNKAARDEIRNQVGRVHEAVMLLTEQH